ncbi:hypothetical protein BH24CHL4_BH24CHL4_03960 [soil metagenome]
MECLRSLTLVTSQFDTLSNEELRNVVGKKWSKYPDCIGAFVAEMDFGTAPEIQQALREVVDEGFFGYVRDADVEAMRVACANWYRTEYGWNIPVERVRSLADVIMGAASGNYRVFATGRPGDRAHACLHAISERAGQARPGDH